MAYDRYSRLGRDENLRNREPGEYGREYGYSDDFGRSSARDYAAAGQFGREGYGERYGRDENRNFDRNATGYRGNWNEGRRPETRGGYDRRPDGYSYQDRGFFDRAGDEVRSWFGDEEAERRRAFDARNDERYDNSRDGDYHGWRNRQIADLDRDYDEYRRENQARFDNEFGSWRNERQGQRGSLSRVNEHMEVVGSDGQHVGTVDKVRGDRIVLTKTDAEAGGHHHSIPSRWIESVDDKVTIRKTADEAHAAWRDEDRSGALFGERDQSTGAHYRNRSFSGTY